MAQTDLVVTQMAVFDGNATANKFKVTEAAADTSNGNKFLWTGREILNARNTNAASTARTFTITSVPDKNGRTKDIATYSVGAGELHSVPPLKAEGWVQPDGYIYVSGSNAELLLSVVRLPQNLPL